MKEADILQWKVGAFATSCNIEVSPLDTCDVNVHILVFCVHYMNRLVRARHNSPIIRTICICIRN